ncbi:putative baseplate assembly protein [candidate division WOR-3 bacterium]|nr:putative baseplate assembly protein [candidate division WOR-3 bacterium]
MLPAPELDDKKFAELVEEAKALIPVYAPEWTDHNIHDPGITFIELFAWLIEMQIYRLDQVSEKNKRRFLKLLGIRPRSAIAAKVDVIFSLPNDYTKSVPVRKGTKVAAKDIEETGEKIVFETERGIHVVPVKLECVISKFWKEIMDNTEANKLDGHFYHAFGEKAEKGSMLYLGFDSFDEKFPDGEIDLMVYLYEADLEPEGKHGEEKPEINPSAEVRWEYSKAMDVITARCIDWAPLELVMDETSSFMCSGRISFRVPTDDAVKCKVAPCEKKKYWLRCRVEETGYEIPPRIDAIQLNTVPVRQGEMVEDEFHDSSGVPDQSFFLQHKPVLAESQVISILKINKLSADVQEGANSLQLSSVPGLQKGDILKIEDGTLTEVEYQIISGITIVVQKMRFAHSAATVEIKKVRVEVPLFTYKLSLDVAEGANSLQLNNIQGLKKDDILRVNDPDRIEYVIIKSVSDTTVTLTGKLLYTHIANTSIEKVKVEEVPVTYKLSDDIEEGANSLKMDKVPGGLQKDDILKIEDDNITEYQLISGITIEMQKMRFSHGSTTTIKKVRVEEVSTYELSDKVEEGADSLKLNSITGLQKYDVLKIDAPDKIEYDVIMSVDTTVTLTGKLLYGHHAKTPVKKVRVDKIPFSEQDKTWRDWKEVDDFDASRPEDPLYVIDHDTGEVIFGDGVHGLIPPAGKKNIKATKYRFGGGERGNIKAEAIDLVLDEELKDLKVTVTNKLPASGGEEKEKIEEAIIRARKDLKKPYRAVTSKDYEDIAKATPGLRVKKAKAIPELDKKKGSVTVVVVPESTLDKTEPSDGFLTTVCKHLDKHRLITTEIHVKEPEYVEVSVNAVVKIKGGYDPDKVKQRVEEALETFLHPLKGGAEGDGWQFGRSVFKSEIYELIDGIEGVDCVQELNMVDEEYRYDGEKIKISDRSLVCSGKHSIRITGPEEECRVEGGFS